jgi:hypothetical protein
MSDSPARYRGDALLAAAVSLVAAVAYVPALSAGFTSDDFLIVALMQETGGLEGTAAFFTRGFYDYYRPLVFLSHALDWELWGMRAAGFHLTNVLLHAANTALVFALGRRLLAPLWACAAALLFGLHPSSHEAVYWIAARFDLAATCFGLIALLALTSGGRERYAAGAAAFLLALLSKESAVAIPIVVAAHDVFLARRSRRDVVRRLAPLLIVMAAYALLRTLAAELPPAGGAGRAGKLAMFVAALAALVLLAGRDWRRRDGGRPASARRKTAAALAPLAIVVLLTVGVLVPLSAAWAREKLTFVAYAAFHLATPVAQPPPPAWFLDPATPVYWLIGLGVSVAVAALVWLGRHRWPHQPALAFLVVFVAAALVPVSTMTGGARYLYLASAGTSLAAALFAQTLLPPWRTAIRVAIALALAVAPMQIVLAGRAWIWASEMSAEAAAAVAPRLHPCGTVEVVLLTAPVGVRGVYSNLNDDTFGTAGCAPASVRAITRVVRDDVPVEITSVGGGAIEWRIPDDRGNVIASHDLRTFDVPLRSGGAVVIDTPLGRLETRRDGDARRFRMAGIPGDRPRVFAYYGGGRVQLLPGTVQ